MFKGWLHNLIPLFISMAALSISDYTASTWKYYLISFCVSAAYYIGKSIGNHERKLV